MWAKITRKAVSAWEVIQQNEFDILRWCEQISLYFTVTGYFSIAYV